MTIDLPIQDFQRWKVVKAEIVSIGEHLPGSFAVHRNPFPYLKVKWRVTNVETGAYCGEGMTKEAAIEQARFRASRCSVARYWGRVRVMCKEFPQVLDTSIAAY